MPYYFQKIFPHNGNAVATSTLKVLLLAEGYTSTQEGQFYQDAFEFYERLYKYPGFASLINDSHALSIYGLFRASANSGYGTSAANATGRTVYESYYDSGQSQLLLNESLVEAALADAFILDELVIEVPTLITTDVTIPSTTGTVVVVLLPSAGISTAENEFQTLNLAFKVATTIDGRFEQVIIRAVCKLVGLWDEFELAGTSYAAPTAEVGQFIGANCSNLFYSDTTPAINPTTQTDFKWRVLFTDAYNQNLPVNPHPGSAATPDRALPAIPVQNDTVALWEGGGGFRSKVYRAASDCLMRRRIGDASLPVKEKVVGLCPVCNHILRIAFGD